MAQVTSFPESACRERSAGLGFAGLRIRASEVRKWATAWAFVASYVLILAVFALVAVLYAFYMSFFRLTRRTG
jgi:hypothetical protein